MSRAREKIKTGKNPQEIVLAIKGSIKFIRGFFYSYGYDFKGTTDTGKREKFKFIIYNVYTFRVDRDLGTG
jgi:hypothetical protein